MVDSDKSNISLRLTDLRLKLFGPRGKRRFAVELGIPLSTYACYEAGRTPPSELLVKAAQVTGCDLEWLLTGQAKSTSAQIADPQIVQILGRMEKVLTAQPKAKQAVEALLDVLAAAPVTVQRLPPVLQKEKQTVIPILGRAAAGLPAFWLEDNDHPIQPLYSIIRSYDANDLAEHLSKTILDPAAPNLEKGSAQIFHFTQAMPLHGLEIDGFIKTENLDRQGKLLAVCIDGDSMVPLLKTGDIAILDTGEPASTGRLAVLEIKNHVGPVCKMFFREKDHVRVASLNRKFDPLILKPSQILWAYTVVAVVKEN